MFEQFRLSTRSGIAPNWYDRIAKFLFNWCLVYFSLFLRILWAFLQNTRFQTIAFAQYFRYFVIEMVVIFFGIDERWQRLQTFTYLQQEFKWKQLQNVVSNGNWSNLLNRTCLWYLLQIVGENIFCEINTLWLHLPLPFQNFCINICIRFILKPKETRNKRLVNKINPNGFDSVVHTLLKSSMRNGLNRVLFISAMRQNRNTATNVNIIASDRPK